MVGREPSLNLDIDWEKEWNEGGTSLFFVTRPELNPPPVIKVGDDDDNDDKDDTNNFGINTAPLIQVFSVHISPNFDDGKPCEIYGSIEALEGLSPRFYLYDRDREDSETIFKQGHLSLIGPRHAPLQPFLDTTLDLRLKDRVRDVELVNTKLCLEPKSDNSYDRLLKGIVNATHGVVYVYYAIFQFAVYGNVQVVITNNDNDDKDRDFADIYGSLVARYENSTSFCTDPKCLEIRLFEKMSHQPTRVLFQTPISLSRDIVVMPAYSSLALELNLSDSHGNIVTKCLQFQSDSSFAPGYPIFQTQHVSVEVLLKWQSPHYTLERDRRIEESHRENSGHMSLEIKSEEGQKKAKVSPYQHRLSSQFIPRPIADELINRGWLKAEVFSVFVGGINQKISALCGTILIVDGDDIFSIYNREECEAELLPDNSLASVEVNYRPIRNADINIRLNLRDPIGKLELSKGQVGCALTSLISNNVDNAQLCAFVRGKDGYAVVHYGVFDDAFEAFLDVKLCSNGDTNTPISFRGSLIARYGGHDYSTSYREKYYTSRLFDCPQNKVVQVEKGSRIPLLKSIVVVPPGSSLIIEAKLQAGVSNLSDSVFGKVEFEVDLSGRPKAKSIGRGNYWIEINVKFEE